MTHPMTDHALRLTCKGKVCQNSCPYLDEYQYIYIYIYALILLRILVPILILTLIICWMLKLIPALILRLHVYKA